MDDWQVQFTPLQGHSLRLKSASWDILLVRRTQYYSLMLASGLEDCMGGVDLVRPALLSDQGPRCYPVEIVKSFGLWFYICFQRHFAAQRVSDRSFFSCVFVCSSLGIGECDRSPELSVRSAGRGLHLHIRISFVWWRSTFSIHRFLYTGHGGGDFGECFVRWLGRRGCGGR